MNGNYGGKKPKTIDNKRSEHGYYTTGCHINLTIPKPASTSEVLSTLHFVEKLPGRIKQRPVCFDSFE